MKIWDLTLRELRQEWEWSDLRLPFALELDLLRLKFLYFWEMSQSSHEICSDLLTEQALSALSCDLRENSSEVRILEFQEWSIPSYWDLQYLSQVVQRCNSIYKVCPLLHRTFALAFRWMQRLVSWFHWRCWLFWREDTFRCNYQLLWWCCSHHLYNVEYVKLPLQALAINLQTTSSQAFKHSNHWFQSLTCQVLSNPSLLHDHVRRFWFLIKKFTQCSL